MRTHNLFERDRRSVTPVVGTILVIAVMFIVASAIGVVALGYTDDITESTTVSAGSGACSFELNFDPADVDGFADERAENAQFSDGSIPCVLWLDASQSPGFDAGSSVSVWTDKSSNNVDATPVSESPTWAVQDGVEAIRFDGDDAYLAAEAPPDAIDVNKDSGLTVTMMVYVVDKSDDNGGLYAIGQAGAGAGGTVFEMRQAPIFAGDEWWVDPGPTTPVTTEGEWAIITHTADGDEGTLYINEEDVGSGTIGSGDLGSDIQIGSAGSGRVFNGYVAEYFISNKQLSDEDRNTIQCAMDAKHDFTVGLNAC